MTMVADEKFFAWLDGELDAAEAAEVEAQVDADPNLQKLADDHRALAARLRTTFDPVADEPTSIQSFATDEIDNVSSLTRARVARAGFEPRKFWAQAAAIAVVFATGIATGQMLFSAPNSPIAPEAGRLVASASLEQALYSELAGQPSEGGPRIGLTYRDKGGKVCRSFTDQAASGIACLDDGDWRMEAVFQSPAGQATEYRMASGTDPRLAAIVDDNIAGEPFDAEQERRARDTGWK